MSLSTHVLDTARGRPAAGMPVRLDLYDGTTWQPVGFPVQVTNPVGMFGGVLPGAPPGVYRAHWTGSQAPGDVVSRTVNVGT